MARAVFLDRDGVINRKPREGDYITRWEHLHFLPGVAEGIALLNRAGFCVIVITNQRCVEKGLVTRSELESLHRQMTESLACAGAALLAVYYCPHELEPVCRCRKPAPGMLLDAARDHGIELAESWMVGDSAIDIQAANNAGCKAVRLVSENAAADERKRILPGPDSADMVAVSFLDAVSQLLGSANGIRPLAAVRAANR